MLFLQFLTVLVALAVAAVGYAQWRTANQRVVIDLHDKRTKAFGQIEQAVFIAFGEGEVTQATFNIFAQGQLDARFIFGDEVAEYLKELRGAFAFVMSFPRQPNGSMPYSPEDSQKRLTALLKITAFHDEGVLKFKPYMALMQKNLSFWRPW